MPQELRVFVVDQLRVGEADTYVQEGLLGLGDTSQLIVDDRPDLVFPPFNIRFPERIREYNGDCFAAIKAKDIVVHHPYESFDVVVQFLRQAGADPDVLAIKWTLYRTSKDSPIVRALKEAAEMGKSVTAVIELKARFDEAANIRLARDLESSGVHVVYGLVGLKTHSKVALVVRREEHGLQTYTHISTGNYNPTTSRVYTDIGLLTSDSMIGDDASDVFNFLTGFSIQKDHSRLLVAPLNLRQRMMQMIRRETAHALAGRPAHISAKINRLTDLPIIEALYEASQAGVKIDLIVRGGCILRPGEPGLSETIHVRSIVGPFLEHSRIFYFANGGDEEVYIGSADWMARNLDRRVEVITPVTDPQLKKYLKDTVLAAYLRDNVKARVMNSDGSYERPAMEPGEEPFNSQLFFEGPNSSPAGKNVHALKSKRLWSKK